MKALIFASFILNSVFLSTCFAAKYTFKDSFGEQASITIPDEEMEIYTSSSKLKSSILSYAGFDYYAAVGHLGNERYLGKVQFEQNKPHVRFVLQLGEWEFPKKICLGESAGVIEIYNWFEPETKTLFCLD